MDLGFVIAGAVLILGGINLLLQFERIRRGGAARPALEQLIDSQWFDAVTGILVLSGVAITVIGLTS